MNDSDVLAEIAEFARLRFEEPVGDASAPEVLDVLDTARYLTIGFASFSGVLTEEELDKVWGCASTLREVADSLYERTYGADSE